MKPPTLLEVVSTGAELDPEIERLLHAARESAEPLPENRARVSRALDAALPVSLGAMLPPGASREGAASGGQNGPAVASPWWRTGGLLVGGLLLGGLGFWLGHDRGYSRGVADALRERLGQVSAGERSPGSAAPRPLAEADELAAAPAAGSEPVAPPASAHGEESSAARQERAPQHTPPRRRHRTTADARTATPASARLPASTNEGAASLTFRQVLEQLRRARQQLRGGQALTSLLILSELERGAGELLLEEREAARVLALCAVGQDSAARDVALRLEQRSPGSIYSTRLAQSCAGAEPSPEGSPSESFDREVFGHAREE